MKLPQLYDHMLNGIKPVGVGEIIWNQEDREIEIDI
jgi:hypothetical protein